MAGGITGKNLYLNFNGTTLDTDYRSFEASEEIGLVDQSGGSDADVTYLTTLRDGTAPVAIVIQADDVTTWPALALGTEGTLEWGEEGTASGKPRSYVNAIVKERRKAMSYNDLAVVDVTWQYSGAVTDGSY